MQLKDKGIHTPGRRKIGTIQQSILQDSPSYDYINNLSPIQPVNSKDYVDNFQSLSSASMALDSFSPRFTRHSNSMQRDICSDNLDGSSQLIAPEICKKKSSLSKAIIEPPEEILSKVAELTQIFQFEHGIETFSGLKFDQNIDSNAFQTQVEIQNENHRVTPNEEEERPHGRNKLKDLGKDEEKDGFTDYDMITLPTFNLVEHDGVLKEHAIDHTPQIPYHYNEVEKPNISIYTSCKVLNEYSEVERPNISISTDCRLKDLGEEEERGGFCDPNVMTLSTSNPLVHNGVREEHAIDYTPQIPYHYNEAEKPNISISTDCKVSKENSGKSEGCRRCNCKKTSCLKLYCECFAAGVYCVEHCSCKECSNTPMHKEKIEAARKQIVSRNPLAFAPKFVPALEPTDNMMEEDNKTPASARHKNGCNCKKSTCQKKYCQCYQGGVGCSLRCRCDGCENVFGRKNAKETVDKPFGVGDDRRSNLLKDKQNVIVNNKPEDCSLKSVVPLTPALENSRKRPCSSTLALTPRKLDFHLQSNTAEQFDSFKENVFIPYSLDDIDFSLFGVAKSNYFEKKNVQGIYYGESSSMHEVMNKSPNGKRVSHPCRSIQLSLSKVRQPILEVEDVSPLQPSPNNDLTNENIMHHSSGFFSGI